MRLHHSWSVVAVACALVSTSLAPEVRADSDVLGGVRLGYYADAGRPFVGGELLFRIAPSVYFNPNLEVVLKSDSYLTFNADVHYDFPHRGRTMTWLGAGLGFVSINPPGPAEGHTDPALNLVFGVGVRDHGIIPYVQAKLIAKQNSEFSIAFGARF